MNKISKTDLNTALVDVRKAYRLLFFYQQRMLNTIKFISDTLSKNVVTGHSLFSNSAPRSGTKLSLDLWPWDWLGMYMFEYNYQDQIIDGHPVKFAIIIQSDTGIYDNDTNITEIDVENFAPEESAKTRVIFIMGKNSWKQEGFIDHEIFKKDGVDQFFIESLEDKLFFAKRYDLTEFIDEENILLTLTDFIKFSKDKGIRGYFPDYLPQN